MRRSLSVLTLAATLSACSMSGSGNAPVAGTPPAPVASSTLASTLHQLSPDALKAVPSELALSFHYRRSDASIKGFAPARSFLEEVMADAKAPADKVQSAKEAMDAMAAVQRVDVFVAAPTTPLKSLDDLQQLAMTGCVTGRLVMDDASPVTAMLKSPPAGLDEQIAPLKFKAVGSTFAVWSPGCEKMPAFADADAVAKTADALVGSATFVSVVQTGHALLHDPVLWAELSKKYHEGVEQSLASNPDGAVVRKYLTRAEAFVQRLNLWKVMRETNVVAESWTFLPNGDWSMDVLVDADTPASAEIMRRSSVGMMDAQILVLTDTASQEIQSLTDGSRMAMNVAYKNPDFSSLLAATGGASSLSSLIGIGMASWMSNRSAMMAPTDDYGAYDENGMRPATIDWNGLQDSGSMMPPPMMDPAPTPAPVK